jgi:hypothetical protein
MSDDPITVDTGSRDAEGAVDVHDGCVSRAGSGNRPPDVRGGRSRTARERGER